MEDVIYSLIGVTIGAFINFLIIRGVYGLLGRKICPSTLMRSAAAWVTAGTLAASLLQMLMGMDSSALVFGVTLALTHSLATHMLGFSGKRAAAAVGILLLISLACGAIYVAFLAFWDSGLLGG